MGEQVYTLNEYQAEAMSFRLESANEQYALMGLAGEVGEVLGLAAKAVRDGRNHDYELNMKKELGDALWFIAAVALDNGYTLEDIAISNVAKLSSRKDRGVLQGSGDNR
jgi:NTP pyrophosphatase (non-canonical NTP hydrolase)